MHKPEGLLYGLQTRLIALLILFQELSKQQQGLKLPSHA
jgi:hypothetical protein